MQPEDLQLYKVFVWPTIIDDNAGLELVCRGVKYAAHEHQLILHLNVYAAYVHAGAVNPAAGNRTARHRQTDAHHQASSRVLDGGLPMLRSSQMEYIEANNSPLFA